MTGRARVNRVQEAEDLAERVFESINAQRHTAINDFERDFIRLLCFEAVEEDGPRDD